jgi:hypothetical protein
MGAARERVRVARRLAELPAVTAAFAEGEISYSKVRAITRVATVANEATLVDLARYMTASHLERTVRCYKRVNDEAEHDQDPSSDPKDQYQERYLTSWWNDDGTLSIKARLPPAEGEMVLTALRRAADALYRQPWAGNAADNATGDDVPAEGNEEADDVPAGAMSHLTKRTVAFRVKGVTVTPSLYNGVHENDRYGHRPDDPYRGRGLRIHGVLVLA